MRGKAANLLKINNRLADISGVDDFEVQAGEGEGMEFYVARLRDALVPRIWVAGDILITRNG
jgi:hypothetical protein